MEQKAARLLTRISLVLAIAWASPALADNYITQLPPQEPNVQLMFISHNGDFATGFGDYEGCDYEGCDYEAPGTTFTLALIGSWSTIDGFPNLIFNPDFPGLITPGIAGEGNSVRFLGFFDTLGPNTIHQIQDVPEGEDPGTIDRAVQDAIGLALLNIHQLIGPGDVLDLQTDEFVNFVLGFDQTESLSFNDVAEVVFANTNFLSAEGEDGFNTAEGGVFPFTPIQQLGTFIVPINNQGQVAPGATFIPNVPEPASMLLLVGGIAGAVWRRRRRAAA